MSLTSFTETLARRSARHPRRVIAAWVVVLIAAALIAVNLLGSALTSTADFTSNPESKQGTELLKQGIRGERQSNEVVIVRSADRTVDDAAFQAAVTGLFDKITALGPRIIQAGSATNFYRSNDPTLVSADRHTTLIPFVMAGTLQDARDHIEQVKDVVDGSKDDPAFALFITGPASVNHDTSSIAQHDLKKGETLGVLLGIVVLAGVFGALVAALLPVILGAVAILVAIGLAALVGQALELSFFVTNMITMIGLAVGIDYSLFIVDRFREERRRGLPKDEAIARAGATASRAVFFSGMTVVLALVGMVIVPTTIFRSLGIGAILVVIVAVSASLTLLPAVLSILGDRINKLRVPVFGRVPTAQAGEQPAESHTNGFWAWAARTVMRQPLVSLVLSAGLLISAAVPFFDLHTGFNGVPSLPDGLESKEGYLILNREFSAGRVTPVDIVISGDVNSPAVAGSIERLRAALAQESVFGRPFPLQANAAGNVALFSVPVNSDASSDLAINAVQRLRRDIIPDAFARAPARVLVSGESAYNVDFFNLTNNITPWVFIFVLGLSFVLLMIVFRSLVVPLKAIILNMLSVGAAYGLLVLVFEKGVANSVLGFQQVDKIEAWIPLFLFSILFGLSMDYHVFLLSRIRERFDQTQDNAAAVSFGLRSTGGLITGAALIMVSVFGGFASGQLVMFQQIGFGLGVAILLDATIVRTVLVPAGMKLLGNVNWYFPSFLKWLPDVRVEPERGTQATARVK